MKINHVLAVIPARGGSKGLPGKNIKMLGGKPLIYHAIDIARSVLPDNRICISTDDPAIARVVEQYPLPVPFLRPSSLAGDQAGMREVLLHVLDIYKEKGEPCDHIILLQPTSPFRTAAHVQACLEMMSPELDMVVSVGESHHNPYFSLFEEDTASGYLRKSKEGVFLTRQASPKVYYYNGAVYIINANSLRERPIALFEKVRKYVMDELHSLDIDTPLDWALCETILSNGYFSFEK